MISITCVLLTVLLNIYCYRDMCDNFENNILGKICFSKLTLRHVLHSVNFYSVPKISFVLCGNRNADSYKLLTTTHTFDSSSLVVASVVLAGNRDKIVKMKQQKWIHHVPVKPYGNLDLDQHWLRQWPVAWLPQAVTWTKVELASLRRVCI